MDLNKLKVIIEIPQGSSIKYELDKETGTYMVDRFLHNAMFYPFNYGFVPDSLSEDGDPLDVIVLSRYPVAPGTGIVSRPVGMLEMEDEEGIDTKIIAVPISKVDPFYDEITDIEGVNAATKNIIKHFFEHYKDLEPNKWVKVRNFLSKEKAYESIKKAIENK